MLKEKKQRVSEWEIISNRTIKNLNEYFWIHLPFIPPFLGEQYDLLEV